MTPVHFRGGVQAIITYAAQYLPLDEEREWLVTQSQTLLRLRHMNGLAVKFIIKTLAVMGRADRRECTTKGRLLGQQEVELAIAIEGQKLAERRSVFEDMLRQLEAGLDRVRQVESKSDRS